MSENPDLSKHIPIVDYPYPRQMIENIKKGRPTSFQELIHTGMVVSYLFFNQEDLQNQINTIKGWASNQDAIIGVDFDKEQNRLHGRGGDALDGFLRPSQIQNGEE